MTMSKALTMVGACCLLADRWWKGEWLWRTQALTRALTDAEGPAVELAGDEEGVEPPQPEAPRANDPAAKASDDDDYQPRGGEEAGEANEQ
jgi:hypothetical protein